VPSILGEKVKLLWPEMLFLLIFPAVLSFLTVVVHKRNSRRVNNYSGLFKAHQRTLQGKRSIDHVPHFLFLLSVFLLTFAVARPSAILNLPSRYNTVILAIDISASMSATDVAPNRFAAAKKAIEEYIAKQRSTTRIGLVSFATAAAVVQKPTPVHTDVLEALEKLQLQGGTAIGNALLLSLVSIFPNFQADLGTADLEPRSTKPNPRGGMTNERLRVKPTHERVSPGSYRDAAIILVSDGEANAGPDPIEVAQVAAGWGVRVYTVGIGTKQGQKLTFQGWSMRVKLDEETMKQIADKTGENTLTQ